MLASTLARRSEHNVTAANEWRARRRTHSLVLGRLRAEHGLPHAGKSLVKAELLPHLEALLAAEGAALDQAVDPPVREAVLVALLVEPRRETPCASRVRKVLEETGRVAAHVCSTFTSSSRSKSMLIRVLVFVWEIRDVVMVEVQGQTNSQWKREQEHTFSDSDRSDRVNVGAPSVPSGNAKLNSRALWPSLEHQEKERYTTS